MSAQGDPLGDVQARVLCGLDLGLLSRVEDAGLNASAPPQQRWVDGWLVRFSAGKAQRARCINAVADGLVGVQAKLEECETLYAGWGLPMLFRITPFTRPTGLDGLLAQQGWVAREDTRVMVLERLDPKAAPATLAGADVTEVPSAEFAQVVGELRGSPAGERVAHAERLQSSPVPYRGFVLRLDGQVAACGQIAVEGAWAGVYDVHTAAAFRGRGLARSLCERLLSESLNNHARSAYLQVGADNHVARHIYSRMGFVDAYTYHYRMRP